MIQDWAPQIDRELRRSAGSRMLSEWAKKVDCWEVIQKLSLQFPNPLPPEISTCLPERQAIPMPDGEKTLDEEIDRDELICMVRPLFRDGDEYERGYSDFEVGIPNRPRKTKQSSSRRD
jgi:hypothetical protein